MLFGDKSRFGIECEVDPAWSSGDPQGRVRLWFGGYDVGDFGYLQNLADVSLTFSSALPIHPDAADFAGKTRLQMLDILYDSDLGVSQRRRRFLLCRDLGSAFDGIYATRISYADRDELLWRASYEIAAHGVILRRGEYDKVVERFQKWLAELSSSRTG